MRPMWRPQRNRTRRRVGLENPFGPMPPARKIRANPVGGNVGSAPPTRTPDISSCLRGVELLRVRIKTKFLELPGPVRVGIAQTLDVDAARQASFGGCLD